MSSPKIGFGSVTAIRSARGGSAPELAQPLAIESALSIRQGAASRRSVDRIVSSLLIQGVADGVLGPPLGRVVVRVHRTNRPVALVLVDHAGVVERLSSPQEGEGGRDDGCPCRDASKRLWQAPRGELSGEEGDHGRNAGN